MTQYARPASDISTGSWTDEGTVDNDGNLYTSVDEVTIDNDDSYIQGSNGAGTAEVKLGAVTDPVGNTDHYWHVFFRSIGSGAGEKMDFYLYCGATLIASSINQSNRSSSYAEGVSTTLLSTSEADAITDYTDLRIRFDEDTIGSGEYVRITQCWFECPDAAGTPVNKDIQALWDIANLVYKDNQAVWDIRNLINKDIQAVWDILDIVNKDLQAVWDILDLVYNDIQAKWDIANLVNKDIQAVWDILTNLAQVNKDMQIIYDIRNVVNKDLQAVWDIFNLVGSNLQAVWDIFNTVGNNLQAVWNIFDIVNKDLQGVWDIRNVVTNTIQAVWDIGGIVSKDLQARWDILGEGGVVRRRSRHLLYTIYRIWRVF